jgi:hypothetical protein
LGFSIKLTCLSPVRYCGLFQTKSTSILEAKVIQ